MPLLGFSWDTASVASLCSFLQLSFLEDALALQAPFSEVIICKWHLLTVWRWFPNPHQLLWGSNKWVMGCWQQWTSLSFSGFSLNLISSGSTLCLQERDSSTINFGCFSSSSSGRWCLPYTEASRWVLCFPGTQEGTCFPWPLGPSLCTQLAEGQYQDCSALHALYGSVFPSFLCPEGLMQGQRAKHLSCSNPTTQMPTWQRKWFKVLGVFKASCTRIFLRPDP